MRCYVGRETINCLVCEFSVHQLGSKLLVVLTEIGLEQILMNNVGVYQYNTVLAKGLLSIISKHIHMHYDARIHTLRRQSLKYHNGQMWYLIHISCNIRYRVAMFSNENTCETGLRLTMVTRFPPTIVYDQI
jgi:hypothetical protein